MCFCGPPPPNPQLCYRLWGYLPLFLLSEEKAAPSSKWVLVEKGDFSLVQSWPRAGLWLLPGWGCEGYCGPGIAPLTFPWRCHSSRLR